jgi:nucleoside-diphosphate-sugar epimerase
MTVEIPAHHRSLDSKRVLVTGATGFLGSHLCRRLGSQGAEVYGVSRRSQAQEGDIQWLQGEMSDMPTARRILMETKPDVIFHLSGLASGLCDLKFVLPTLHSLFLSTVNVLTVAAEMGPVRVILAGSLTEPTPDADEPTPGSPYAAAKWASSAYGRMFSTIYDLPVVILRIFMTYGPGQDARKLIPHVILSLLRNKSPELSNGRWEADWVYIDDVIDGLVAAARSPNVTGRTIDLGCGRLVSVRAIIEQLVELTGARVAPAFGALPDRPLEQVRVADVERTERMLGWKAMVSLNEGLRRTVDAYRRGV